MVSINAEMEPRKIDICREVVNKYQEKIKNEKENEITVDEQLEVEKAISYIDGYNDCANANVGRLMENFCEMDSFSYDKKEKKDGIKIEENKNYDNFVKIDKVMFKEILSGAMASIDDTKLFLDKLMSQCI